MLRKYKIEVTELPDNKVKVTYTLKNHVQFSETISEREAYLTRRIHYKNSKRKISNKIDQPIKSLLRYGYFLYWLYGKEIAKERLSNFVNLNII